MIKQLVVNGETLINVPADKAVLIELGLSELEAGKAIIDHRNLQDLELVRTERAPLLMEADCLVNIALDNGLDITAYRQYRQALRDVTKNFDASKGVVWPQKPSLQQASS